MGSHAFLHAATWEGDLYCEDLRNPASETGLKPRSFPMMPRAGNTSDFCGSFVVFSRQHNCFVMSRAVGKELFVFDAQLSNLLLHVVFDDFFRGILLQNSPLFLTVCACTNRSIYRFHVCSDESIPMVVSCSDSAAVHRLEWLKLPHRTEHKHTL